MLLTIPANLWVASQLGPEALGKVNIVALLLMYASLVRPGFFEGGTASSFIRLDAAANERL